MRFLASAATAALAFLLTTGAFAQTTVSGVKYDDAIDLRGSRLVLNGAGTRHVAVLKYYTAGLYMTRKAGTPEEALALPGAKRISVVSLREIDSGDLGKRFTRGVEDNLDRAAFSKLIPGLMRMSQIFSDTKKLSPGDTFTIDWVPGTGTIISVKGVPQGEPFKEPEFFNALLRIWLGNSPADRQLKDAMLGKSAAALAGPQAN